MRTIGSPVSFEVHCSFVGPAFSVPLERPSVAPPLHRCMSYLSGTRTTTKKHEFLLLFSQYTNYLNLAMCNKLFTSFNESIARFKLLLNLRTLLSGLETFRHSSFTVFSSIVAHSKLCRGDPFCDEERDLYYAEIVLHYIQNMAMQFLSKYAVSY